jgi:RHS repeat-associated protein
MRAWIAPLLVLLLAAPAEAAVKRADLRVTRLGGLPATVNSGATVKVTATVANRGRARAGASSLQFLLSANRARDRRDVVLATTGRVSALAAGTSARRTVALRIPASAGPGLFFVLSCADARSRVRETSERNNCRASASAIRILRGVTISPPAPVAPPLTQPSVTDPAPAPLETATPTPTATPTATPSLPPDPSQVAPAPDPTGAMSVHASTAFLYTGSDPIQADVAPGAIEPVRAAALRGRVLTRSGQPLPAVEVRIKDHPELGRTLTRADGRFDLAVNGGGTLTVSYARAGYLTVDRLQTLTWEDLQHLPDVVLTALDSAASGVDLQTGGLAAGTPSSDADGTRQALLAFAPGTQGEMTLADGTRRPLGRNVTVRATEFTVGERGPEAMPAPLPATSAYTYAVDFRIDEAAVAGATRVDFTQPVHAYVDNFLGFPAGTTVPSGYYDEARAAWVASDNGRVLEIVGAGGAIDADGDGAADSASALAALGIDAAERTRLAGLYAVGESLWRVPIAHFSKWDLNWGWSPPADAEPPPLPDLDNSPAGCGTMMQSGSIIDCSSQTLGEDVPVVGTPFSLAYRSNRVPGRAVERKVEIPVSPGTLPTAVRGIKLEVTVGGRIQALTFPPEPNQSYTFHWDGRDAYGRTTNGEAAVTVRLGYTYDGVYAETPRFGYDGNGIPITGDWTRMQVTLWSVWRGRLGAWDARGTGLGAWTLTAHHRYDPFSHTLYRGDGERLRGAADPLGAVLQTALGDGQPGDSGDSGPATAARIDTPAALTARADGSLLVADSARDRVRIVARTGTVAAHTGSGEHGFAGDGGPAAAARLSTPQGLATGADGTVYVADTANNRVRAIDAAGVIRTVAGGGVQGDGGPATAARLNGPADVAVGADGTLYIAEQGAHRVRRVSPDGRIETVAGTGDPGFRGDGGPANAARLRRPRAVAVDDQGSLFIADTLNDRVRRVDPDGSIRTVAGGGPVLGDDGPATTAALRSPEDVAIAADGTLLIADTGQDRVRRVLADGTIITVAGGGTRDGDGASGQSSRLRAPAAIAVMPGGGVMVAERSTHRVRRLAFALPGFIAGNLAIPSPDGTELHEFDPSGRHLRTVDTLTGATRFTFGYDGAGRLVSVRDHDGNVTTVERAASGAPEAIVAQDGQRTALTLDANGFLASIRDPAGATHGFAYTTDGLLTGYTDPNGHSRAREYDADGRLTANFDAAGKAKRLTRSGDHEVTFTTPEGRSSKERLTRSPSGTVSSSVTGPSAATRTQATRADGTTIATATDGTRAAAALAPDPRFGMLSAFDGQSTLDTPGGLQAAATSVRNVQRSDQDDPLSLQTLTQTLAVNGRSSTVRYDAATRTWQATSAAGRLSTTVTDASGRPLTTTVPGLPAERAGYDGRGRLRTVTVDPGGTAPARTTTFAYGADGFVASVTDPLSRSVVFTRDLAGRVTGATFPGERNVAFSYDSAGNLLSVAPPGRAAHRFEYDANGQLASYRPPDAAPTTYGHDSDGDVTRMSRPGEGAVTFARDGAGRVQRIESDAGAETFDYDGADRIVADHSRDGVTTTYAYDGGLPTTATWSGAVTGSYATTFTADMVPASDQVGGTAAVGYAYDDDLLLIGAGEETVARDPANGLVTGTALGSVATAAARDDYGQLASATATHAGTPLYRAAFVRDALGRITRREETLAGGSRVDEYEYDTSGRLARVLVDGVESARYEYDANGNRTRAGSRIATFDGQDRLVADGDMTFHYDAAGDLEEVRRGAVTTRYDYDSFGNLRAVDLADGTRVRYLVDAQHRRVATTVDGTRVESLLYADELRPIASVAGDVVTRFVYATDGNVPDQMIRGGRTYRVISDERGSVRLVVDAADGAVAQRLDYDEFGRVTRDTNPGFQPFGYGGGLYDFRTGLVRFGARDYDAGTGRFTTRDPLGVASGDTNLYVYAADDPINLTDPDGRVVPVVAAGAAAAAPAVAGMTVPMLAPAGAAAGAAAAAGVGAVTAPVVITAAVVVVAVVAVAAVVVVANQNADKAKPPKPKPKPRTTPEIRPYPKHPTMPNYPRPRHIPIPPYYPIVTPDPREYPPFRPGELPNKPISPDYCVPATTR